MFAELFGFKTRKEDVTSSMLYTHTFKINESIVTPFCNIVMHSELDCHTIESLRVEKIGFDELKFSLYLPKEIRSWNPNSMSCMVETSSATTTFLIQSPFSVCNDFNRSNLEILAPHALKDFTNAAVIEYKPSLLPIESMEEFKQTITIQFELADPETVLTIKETPQKYFLGITANDVFMPIRFGRMVKLDSIKIHRKSGFIIVNVRKCYVLSKLPYLLINRKTSINKEDTFRQLVRMNSPKEMNVKTDYSKLAGNKTNFNILERCIFDLKENVQVMFNDAFNHPYSVFTLPGKEVEFGIVLYHGIFSQPLNQLMKHIPPPR